MTQAERFIEVVLEAYRSEQARSDGQRRAEMDDRIQLLADYRQWGLDQDGLRRLIASLRAGEARGRLSGPPAALGDDLARRWEAFTKELVPATA